MASPGFGQGFLGEDAVFAYRAVSSAGVALDGLAGTMVPSILRPDGSLFPGVDVVVDEIASGTHPGLYRVTGDGSQATLTGVYYLTVSDSSATMVGPRTIQYEVTGERAPTVVSSVTDSLDQELEVLFDAVTWAVTASVVDEPSLVTNRVFTMKVRPTDTDANALLVVDVTTGILTLNGAPPVAPVVAGDGVLSFSPSTTALIDVEARATVGLAGAGRRVYWDIKAFDASSPENQKIIATGTVPLRSALRQTTTA